ncbi:helix-turn-helix domain-containing protein [Bacteroides sp.]
MSHYCVSYYLFVFLILFSLQSCRQATETDQPDVNPYESPADAAARATVYDINTIDRLYPKYPERALILLDSLRHAYQRDGYPDPLYRPRIELIASLIHKQMNRMRLSAYYAEECVSEARKINHIRYELEGIMQLVDDYMRQNNDAMTTYWINELQEKSLQVPQYSGYRSAAYRFQAKIAADAGNYPEAILRIEACRKILEKDSTGINDITECDLDHAYYLTQMSPSHLDEAISIALNALQRLKNTRPNRMIDRTGIDLRMIGCHICLMQFYLKTGKASKALEHYHAANKLGQEYPEINYYAAEISQFLNDMHLYTEAQAYADEQISRLQHSADTLNSQHVSMLRLLAQTQQKLNHPNEANALYNRALTLTDSLVSRQQQQALMEFSVINQLQQYKDTIRQQEQQLHTHRQLSLLGALILLLSSAVIMLALRHIRHQQKYNKSLFVRIREQQKAEEELQRLRTLAQSHTAPLVSNTTMDDTTANNKTLDCLDSWLNEDNRFLCKDITADEAARQCYIDKRELNELLLTHRQLNFADYLTTKRLSYACRRLLDPDYATVEVVAEESGFNSLRTFLRRFKEQYNLSPTEWRKIARELNENSTS